MRSRAVLAAAAVALAGAQVARAESPVERYNAADQAAAKAAVIRATDLGAGWRGGPQKADVTFSSPCPEQWNPKQADLVVTGAAESAFTHADGVSITSITHVMQTTRMVAVDWRRTVIASAFVACMRRALAANYAGTKVLSFGRTSFARLAPLAARYRGILEVRQNARTIRVVVDIVALGRGRAELSLMLVAPFAQRAEADASEVRLSRLLLGRVRV